MLACGERGYGDGSTPTCYSAVSPCFHSCLTFIYRHFPPRSPSYPLYPTLCSQQQPLHWDCSTIPKLQLPAAAPSWRPTFLPDVYGCGKDCPIFIPFRLPQISCFSLSLKCFSSDSDNCPAVGIPHLLRAGPLLLTLLFFPLAPSSYRPLCDCIHSFPLVRPSCPLLAGVLRAFLCLKVYSCCIHGERCTPCPPTPSPSRSSMIILSYEN